ncbi:MAG: kinase [Asticcacaulis sp.]
MTVPSEPGSAAVITTRHIIEARAKAARSKPFITGICGCQGSGKSTLSQTVSDQLQARGIKTIVISIDDLYLTRAQRRMLAGQVHPLLATRGPPGTHDIALAETIFNDLLSGRPATLPRFDKAADDRLPESEWQRVSGPLDVVLFEGWCVGARPQAASDLVAPVNDLEKIDDPAAVWRTYVNHALATSYQSLFALIDDMVLLAAPRFEIVADWRRQQEHGLIAAVKNTGGPAPFVMSDSEIARFILFYERLSRHILAEMPSRADLVLNLDDQRRLKSVLSR